MAKNLLGVCITSSACACPALPNARTLQWAAVVVIQQVLLSNSHGALSLERKATLLSSLRHTTGLQLVKVEAAAVHVTCMPRMASEEVKQAGKCMQANQ